MENDLKLNNLPQKESQFEKEIDPRGFHFFYKTFFLNDVENLFLLLLYAYIFYISYIHIGIFFT